MIDLYKASSSATGSVVAILFEEASLPYRVHVLDPGKGGAREGVLANPTATLPMIVDPDGPSGEVRVCEVGAIMIYLAGKTGRFLPRTGPDRASALQWVLWSSSTLGPATLAYRSALKESDPDPSAIRRAGEAVVACAAALDRRLGEADYLAGEYSIADMCVYPYLPFAIAELPAVWDLANLRRWLDATGARPGVTQRTQLRHQATAARPVAARPRLRRSFG